MIKTGTIPEEVCKAWDCRSGPVVFSTVDLNGMPNAIYVTCVSRYNESIIVVADNYFDKTRQNILSGSKASVLFITGDKTSYQLKGTIKYLKGGMIFRDMKKWNPPQHPGRGVVVLQVKEVYRGSVKLK
jgi:predicted pyridoxine 5'-phosphate oxidase superfamily flavin-nucleotide-binding protein